MDFLELKFNSKSRLPISEFSGYYCLFNPNKLSAMVANLPKIFLKNLGLLCLDFRVKICYTDWDSKWINVSMNWWIDELVNWWIDELVNWWIGELMNDELMNWWIDELVNWWIDEKLDR